MPMFGQVRLGTRRKSLDHTSTQALPRWLYVHSRHDHTYSEVAADGAQPQWDRRPWGFLALARSVATVERGSERPIAPSRGSMRRNILHVGARSLKYSQGVPEVREFLASEVNRRDGVRVTADDIVFFNDLDRPVDGLGSDDGRLVSGGDHREARVRREDRAHHLGVGARLHNHLPAGIRILAAALYVCC